MDLGDISKLIPLGESAKHSGPRLPKLVLRLLIFFYFLCAPAIIFWQAQRLKTRDTSGRNAALQTLAGLALHSVTKQDVDPLMSQTIQRLAADAAKANNIGQINEMLRLLATLKFQDQAGTGTTKTNGKIGEVGTCTIESRAELVQESNRFAAGLEPKALEGVRITQRLRDYQQVLQYAARRRRELELQINYMKNGNQSDLPEKGRWGSKTPIPEMEKEFAFRDDQFKEAEKNVSSLEPVWKEFMEKFPALSALSGLIPTSRLNPKLYEIDTGRPRLSFMLNYYKRPWAIENLVKEYSQCNDLIPSELLINVDNDDEAQEWVKYVYPTRGFVVPVFSFNFHEARGYNRLAGLARGDVVVILQDDMLPPDNKCQWAVKLMSMFDKYPRLGAVGLKHANIISSDGGRHAFFGEVAYRDLDLGISMQFVLQADYAPFAARRDAFIDIGGIDESFGHRGECGIVSDWELTYRMWAAGWQVAHTALFAGFRGDGHEGSTHNAESLQVHQCWGKNMGLGFDVLSRRFNGVKETLEKLVIQSNIELLDLKNKSDPEPWKNNPGRCTDHKDPICGPEP